MITTGHIVELCGETTAIFAGLDCEQESTKSDCRIVLPVCRERLSNRRSEQEFRQLFIKVLESRFAEVRYAIEAPTQKSYKFSGVSPSDFATGGEGSRSGLIDLTLYSTRDSKHHRELNIEFKYGHNNIEKDIFKLISERPFGILVMILPNINSGTLDCIRRKIDKTLEYHSSKQPECEKKIKFIFCLPANRSSQKDRKVNGVLCVGDVTKESGRLRVKFIDPVLCQVPSPD